MNRYKVTFNLFFSGGTRLRNKAKLILEVDAETASDARQVASDDASTILGSVVVGGQRYDAHEPLAVATVKIPSK